MNKKSQICPYCQSSKVIKNGFSGKEKVQRFRCKDCKKSFQERYTYHGSDPSIRKIGLRLLSNNGGIRQTSEVLQVNSKTVLSWILLYFPSRLEVSPLLSHYEEVEVDEFWSFVGSKANVIWWFIAYCKKTREVLACVKGERDWETVAHLERELKKLPITIDYICTDKFKGFAKIFPKEKHKEGKEFTKGVEGNNTMIRTRNRRTNRRTTCFSKQLMYHEKVMYKIIQDANQRRATKTRYENSLF